VLGDNLVLGENGVAFATDFFYNITAFDLATGQVRWNYAPGQGALGLIAAEDAGGLVAKVTDQNNLDTVVRFDATGLPTFDSWSAPGITYDIGDFWLCQPPAGVALCSLAARAVALSGSSWYAPDGNGDHAAVPNLSVKNFSQAGANQAAIASVLQNIAAALPNNTSCNDWLQTGQGNQGGSGLQVIQAVVANNNFGHGTVYEANSISNIAAFTGNKNADGSFVSGVPLSAAFTVNDVGAFFNQYQNGDQTKPFAVGARGYAGNTLRAQATILIHETAHIITVSGFQRDAGIPKAGKANDKLVDRNCRQLIEGLQ
jgi:hypothetical protein